MLTIHLSGKSIIAAVWFTALGAGVSLLAAGPLTPPSGAVSSTNKTLSEVEPRIAINSTNTPGDNDATPSLYKITAPGSYYLTGNLAGIAGKHGIEITTSGVTIDLNGFSLIGNGDTSGFDGITATVTGLTDIHIRNGNIRNWGGDGIDFFDGTNQNVCVSDVSANGNAGHGIAVGNNAIITRCAVRSSGGDGFRLFSGCVISDCAARNNVGNGINASNGCTVSNCVAVFNFTDGILAGSQCLLIDNQCTSNGQTTGTGAGIRVSGVGTRVEGNNCCTADRGIQIDGLNNIIVRNTCSGNTINWAIAANNQYGPIINRVGAATAAVSGNAATSTLTTTEPNANFSY